MVLNMEQPIKGEKFNTRLFFLQIINEKTKFILIIVITTLLIGGGYWGKQTILGLDKDYQIIQRYNIEYEIDPYLESMFVYINEATWNSYFNSDILVRDVLEANKELSKQEVCDATLVKIQSDVRLLEVVITTKSKDITENIAKVYQESFIDFRDVEVAIKDIKLIDSPTKAVVVKRDVRVGNAIALGFVVGVFLAYIYAIFKFLVPDFIIIPEQLAIRHRLKALGYNGDRLLEENVKYLIKNKKSIALLPVTKMECGPLMDEMNSYEKNTAFSQFEPADLKGDKVEELRKQDGVILIVQASKDVSANINRVLAFLEIQEIKVLGAILVNADYNLLQKYYKGRIYKIQK